jgi:membrane protein implicated in regulation of membrane protease activity
MEDARTPSTWSRVLIYGGLVLALAVIGFFIGVAHANALCNGGDCEVLVVLIYYWTLGAFLVSLLAIFAAEVVRQRRSRRARLK